MIRGFLSLALLFIFAGLTQGQSYFHLKAWYPRWTYEVVLGGFYATEVKFDVEMKRNWDWQGSLNDPRFLFGRVCIEQFIDPLTPGQGVPGGPIPAGSEAYWLRISPYQLFPNMLAGSGDVNTATLIGVLQHPEDPLNDKIAGQKLDVRLKFDMVELVGITPSIYIPAGSIRADGNPVYSAIYTFDGFVAPALGPTTPWSFGY